MSRTYLESTSGKHHKFYEVVRHRKDVRLRWGRIGSEGQRLLHVCETLALAEKVEKDKIAEKLRGGYEPKSEPSPRKPVEQPHPRQLGWSWTENPQRRTRRNTHGPTT